MFCILKLSKITEIYIRFWSLSDKSHFWDRLSLKSLLYSSQSSSMLLDMIDQTFVETALNVKLFKIYSEHRCYRKHSAIFHGCCNLRVVFGVPQASTRHPESLVILGANINKADKLISFNI